MTTSCSARPSDFMVSRLLNTLLHHNLPPSDYERVIFIEPCAVVTSDWKNNYGYYSIMSMGSLIKSLIMIIVNKTIAWNKGKLFGMKFFIDYDYMDTQSCM